MAAISFLRFLFLGIFITRIKPIRAAHKKWRFALMALVGLYVCMPFATYAQGKPFFSLFHKKPLFDEVGFQSGFGYETASNRVPEGTYRPLYFMAHLANHLLTDSARKNAWGVPLFYAEPQINPVFIQKPDGSVQIEWEFGINNGLKHTLQITKNMAFYVLVGSGPHFFTTKTLNQHRGFIFSDCFGGGTQVWVTPTSSFTLNFRIRHMSNLELFQPNSGINTYNFHWGWSWWLP